MWKLASSGGEVMCQLPLRQALEMALLELMRELICLPIGALKLKLGSVKSEATSVGFLTAAEVLR